MKKCTRHFRFFWRKKRIIWIIDVVWPLLFHKSMLKTGKYYKNCKLIKKETKNIDHFGQFINEYYFGWLPNLWLCETIMYYFNLMMLPEMSRERSASAMIETLDIRWQRISKWNKKLNKKNVGLNVFSFRFARKINYWKHWQRTLSTWNFCWRQ